MVLIFCLIVIDSIYFVLCHEIFYTVSKCSILRLCYAVCLLLHMLQERKIWYLLIKFSSDISGIGPIPVVAKSQA